MMKVKNIIDTETIDKKVNEAKNQGFLNGFDFSILMQQLLISKDGYVIDTGNYENVNAVIADRLVNNIKKHPLLWRFFMII